MIDAFNLTSGLSEKKNALRFTVELGIGVLSPTLSWSYLVIAAYLSRPPAAGLPPQAFGV